MCLQGCVGSIWLQLLGTVVVLLGSSLYLLEELRDDLLKPFNDLWVGRWWALAADHELADIPASRRTSGVGP